MPNFEKHLRKIENKSAQECQIRGIDYIYFVNLDQRRDKLERTEAQFKQYGISAQRFPAVNGWRLSQEVFDEVGVKLLPPIDWNFGQPVTFSHLQPSSQKLDASSYGKTCIHHCTTAGALGCFLSHLSVLHDAYHSGYQRIWLLEDDFTLQRDPRLLSESIERLDLYTGGDWDILYTDDDKFYLGNGWITIESFRPDIPWVKHFHEHTPVEDFFRIGGRTQLHSAIIHRSGIEKIVAYFKKYGVFRHIDVEISFIPGMKKYNSTSDIVHGRDQDHSKSNTEGTYLMYT